VGVESAISKPHGFFDMKELYKGHAESIRRAAAMGRLVLDQQKQERIQIYNKNPTLCTNCECSLEYEKKNNKFCSNSCATSYNNRIRGKRSDKTKKQISSTVKKYYSIQENKNKLRSYAIKGNEIKTNLIKIEYNKSPNKCNVCSAVLPYERRNKKRCSTCFRLNTGRILDYNKSPNKCNVCSAVLPYERRNKKTCSYECRIIACTQNRTYQNGSRKPIWYFNKYQNKSVLLDSSWEVRIAKLLDELQIYWIRPYPMKWSDGTKDRYYYPDFYLKDYNLYLDPKNPYCMELDKYKMEVISDMVDIVYGDISYVESYIKSL
jgi:hypothetical protein